VIAVITAKGDHMNTATEETSTQAAAEKPKGTANFQLALTGQMIAGDSR
jgi:hypothetical protein